MALAEGRAVLVTVDAARHDPAGALPEREARGLPGGGAPIAAGMIAPAAVTPARGGRLGLEAERGHGRLVGPPGDRSPWRRWKDRRASAVWGPMTAPVGPASKPRFRSATRTARRRSSYRLTRTVGWWAR